MEIMALSVGNLGTNCYIIYDHTEGSGIVLDPGAEGERILNALKDLGLRLEAILLTHAHADHVAALQEVRQKTGAPVMIHAKDAPMLADPDLNLSSWLGLGELRQKADRLLTDDELLTLVGAEFQVIHTPGHSEGSSCFYCKEQGILFSGDTLFAGSIGRTDLPGGDVRKLRVSLEQILQGLPDETSVYPGHGAKTVLAREKGALSLLD